ncbi:NADH-quinone oxidoreductase subunit NuoN [Candidatus Erwinia haradaeae]|uniref:NADH-quinone oxidoreductase subunit N n=1 Tax=Candidatus Erwinia haradaeae TaxID=1922217 RepID=A0A451D1N4_9GAMM|nr:NADH-quinone oxidoreductase subunit NuoN [Candidatus Erwinia haradaeae]VFP79519.1 NADH-quinone oxidoreductase subunit N [Candidatus Erwinia haradaeae]
MIFSYQQCIALLPLLILWFTVVAMVFSIGVKRNHHIIATITYLGLILALFSLYFVAEIGETDIASLFRVDKYSIFYTILVIIVSLFTCIFSYPWLSRIQINREEFYLLLVISTIGGITLSTANHFISLFIGIELMSLPLCGLVGYVFEENFSLEAALKYMILSAVSSAFFIFGMALLYANTGTLNFCALKAIINSGLIIQPLLVAGFGLMIVSFGFKLSLVPFHLWTPDVYQGASAPVGMFLASASKIVILGALMRLFISTSLRSIEVISFILTIIAVLSMLFGNLMALRQENIKRILGYSSISHFGYLFIACISGQDVKQSLEVLSVCLVSYLISSVGAFGIVCLMRRFMKNKNPQLICSYRGLFWRHPILAIAMTIIILSLAGIPMTLGFISKFYLISIGVSSHLWVLIGALVLGSSIGLYYYLRIIISLYLTISNYTECSYLEYNWACTPSGISVLALAALLLVLGIYPEPIIELAQLVQLRGGEFT